MTYARDVELVREALREPYEVRGDGGVSRKAIADALTALDSLEGEVVRGRDLAKGLCGTTGDYDEAWAAIAQDTASLEARLNEARKALERIRDATDGRWTSPAAIANRTAAAALASITDPEGATSERPT